MTLEERINTFKELASFLKRYQAKLCQSEVGKKDNLLFEKLNKAIHLAKVQNPWFTEENIHFAIESIQSMLDGKNLDRWINQYPGNLLQRSDSKKIAVIMAGNIPLVGFHDMLCVLLSGNAFIGKLSSKDEELLPVIAEIIFSINPKFSNYIYFEKGFVKDFDAVIATGSDNTSRYFDYYFGKYPHIIRKNRNAVAVLSGYETQAEIGLLAKDIFHYFGLGCRNVSKVFFPEKYNTNKFFEGIEAWKDIYNHNKYANNYEYYKSIYLMNLIPHLDNGFLLLKKDANISSPVGVVFYEFYNNIAELYEELKRNKEKIQCIVGSNELVKEAIPFGKAQQPEIWNYADDIDTMNFLINLK
jgi:hypothetical protein